LLAAGWRRAWVALSLWAAGVAGEASVGNASYWFSHYASWLVLLVALAPDGEAWRWRGKKAAIGDWIMPGGVLAAAWVLLAAGWALVGAGLWFPAFAAWPGVLGGVALLQVFTLDAAWLPARSGRDGRAVLFYDGECGLCNAVVRFLLREDPGAVLRFAALQSPLGQNELRRAGLPLTDFDSLLFTPDLRGHRRFLRTRGVIGVLDALGGIWRMIAWVSWLMPGPLRDAVYKLVARTRYALFGVYAPRPLENPCWAERFLVD
jgi:predicted DCC family thiol-disulfide oxidoreductase YuxK